MREQSLWRRGTTPIIAKYQDEHKKVMSVIAGRGFSALPGYAYDIENSLELNAKLNLSELNFKILSETTEREIKQAGINYDSDYKTALMAWEIEKQSLMAAWDEELGGIKLGMAHEESTLDMLAIEVGKRSVVLIEQKTALELQMEAYKKTLAEMDSATSSYEVQLATAKLLTIQKKLEIIPILGEIVRKEEILLLEEQKKAEAYTELIAAENEVSLKKQELFVPNQELVNKTEELINKTSDRIANDILIAGEKIKQSEADVTKAGYKVEELLSEAEAAEKKIALLGAKRDIEGMKFDYGQDLISQEFNKDIILQGEIESAHQNLLDKEGALHSTELSNKQSSHYAKTGSATQSASRLSTAEINSNTSIANRNASGEVDIAKIKAASKISSTLVHLIGAT